MVVVRDEDCDPRLAAGAAAFEPDDAVEPFCRDVAFLAAAVVVLAAVFLAAVAVDLVAVRVRVAAAAVNPVDWLTAGGVLAARRPRAVISCPACPSSGWEKTAIWSPSFAMSG